MIYGNYLDPRGKPPKKYNPLAEGGRSSNPKDEAKRLFARGQDLMRDIRAVHRGSK